MDRPELIKNKVQELLNLMGISPDITVTEEQLDDEFNYSVLIEGKDLNFLIGYHGNSLNALQTLLGLILNNEFEEWYPITVDINGYRSLREEKLQEMVKNYIDRTRFSGDEVHLPTMPAFERRLVHMFVSEYDDIESESRGEGLNRRVILRPTASFVEQIEEEDN
ncbi:MAG: protein jag [Patescibacteria group bacterium]